MDDRRPSCARRRSNWSQRQRPARSRWSARPGWRHDRDADRTRRWWTGRNRIDLPLRIADPKRWFPLGYGAQDRYTFAVTLRDANGDLHAIQRTTGLRTVELRRAKDRWGKSMDFVVNGIPVFAKGANLIPLDSFPTRVDERACAARCSTRATPT